MRPSPAVSVALPCASATRPVCCPWPASWNWTVNYSCDDLETLHEHWQDYNIIPKACNIQMVFYRPVGTTGNDADKILVKVLFNEHEATLPFTPVTGPYYRWTDLKTYYERKLATPIDWRVE